MIKPLQFCETKSLKMAKEMITIKEAAAFTSLSKSFLYKLTCTGRIPCYKPTGKRLYFDEQELIDWMKSNPVKSAESIKTESATHVVLGQSNKVSK